MFQRSNTPVYHNTVLLCAAISPSESRFPGSLRDISSPRQSDLSSSSRGRSGLINRPSVGVEADSSQDVGLVSMQVPHTLQALASVGGRPSARRPPKKDTTRRPPRSSPGRRSWPQTMVSPLSVYLHLQDQQPDYHPRHPALHQQFLLFNHSLNLQCSGRAVRRPSRCTNLVHKRPSLLPTLRPQQAFHLILLSRSRSSRSIIRSQCLELGPSMAQMRPAMLLRLTRR